MGHREAGQGGGQCALMVGIQSVLGTLCSVAWMSCVPSLGSLDKMNAWILEGPSAFAQSESVNLTV